MKELCAVAVKLPTPNAALIRAFRDSLTLERPAQIGQNKARGSKLQYVEVISRAQSMM